MKRTCFIVVCLMTFLPALASAETVEELFNSAVREYDGESADGSVTTPDYVRATDIFRDLYETYRIESPEVLLNLGASEFLSATTAPAAQQPAGETATTSGKIGESMAFLHKAMKLAPDSLAARIAAQNLDKIRKYLNEESAADHHPGYVFAAYNDGWTAMFSWLNPDLAIVLFLVFWTMFFVALVLRRLVRGRFMTIALTALAVLTLVCGFGAVASNRVARYSTGVVVNPETALFKDQASVEPGDTLPEGLEFLFLERQGEGRGEWVRIRLSSGQTGWVKGRDVLIP